ncbi:MAG TPA: hypothetical protein VNR00_17560, partial [Opitutus sp.]|nr:hypothetical protein [Opitutus sp.]
MNLFCPIPRVVFGDRDFLPAGLAAGTRARVGGGILRLLVAVAIGLLASHEVQAGARGLVDTTRSAAAKMYMVDLGDVRWKGGLLGERFETCRAKMIPHLWDIFVDPVASHAW